MGVPEHDPTRVLREMLVAAIEEDRLDRVPMQQAGYDPDNVDHQDAWHQLKQIGHQQDISPGKLLALFEDR